MTSIFSKKTPHYAAVDETKRPPKGPPQSWADMCSPMVKASPVPMRDKVLAPKPKFGKRRPRTGQPSRRRAGDITVNAYDIANKAWQASKYIMSMINVEQKFFDVNSNFTALSTGAIANLSNVAEGSDYLNRDGNSILLQRIEFACYISQQTSILTVPCFVRCMIFCDKMQRGTDPTLAEILETTSVNVNIVSPVLHYTAGRFQVLYDKVFTLSVGNATGHAVSFEKELHQHVMYSSTTGADASNWTGALYLLFLSNDAVNPPTVQMYNRLVFTDN